MSRNGAILICIILAIISSATELKAQDDEQLKFIYSRIDSLSKSSFVEVLTSGASTQGRKIPAFIISDFNADISEKKRVLICAGQHGNEYNPVKSVIKISEELIKENDPLLLSRCLIIVVPVVNVDGYANFERLNSQGIDINRDWINLRSSEANFVHSLIKLWKPHLMIDLHEWVEPSSIPGNSIEVVNISDNARESQMRKFALNVGEETGSTIIACGHATNSNLFHRRYTKLGFASYLIETAYGESAERKYEIYSNAVKAILRELATGNVNTAILSPAAASFEPQAVSAYIKKDVPMQKQASSIIFYAVVAGCLVYSIGIWIRKPCTRLYRKHRIDCTPHILVCRNEKSDDEESCLIFPPPPPDFLRFKVLVDSSLRRKHIKENNSHASIPQLKSDT